VSPAGLWMLHPVVFVVGVFTVFFDVTHQSYLPSSVRREQLLDALAHVVICADLVVGRAGLYNLNCR
jgi:hypothetical protein